ncbi:MAG TPA: hypothetical protein VK536_00935 [Candidatus Limnocylindrales bacterium]|nr:hypothetical protein [Candidatus Limnocylindrales bacterium]
MCPKKRAAIPEEPKIMINQAGLNEKKILVNNEILDWIAVTSLVFLIFSLMMLLFLNYASHFVKGVDLTIMTVSLIVMLITLPIHGRERRIAKLVSFFKKISNLSDQ